MPDKQGINPKRIIMYCALIAVAAAAILVTILLTASRTQAPAYSTEGTFTGEVVCLPHKDKSGPTTLECAMGLLTDDGRYYELRTDPGPLEANVGDRVEFRVLLERSENSIYESQGVIYGSVRP